MDELYKKGFGLGADDEEEEENDGSLAKKAMELLEHDKQRYAPKLKQKKFRANIPSMMEICCNGVEVLRLRNLLVRALIQREALLKIYASQMKSMSKDYKPNFKDYGFNFETFQKGAGSKWKDYVDSGPGLRNSVAKAGLAIGEFDPSLVSCLNFSDPESYKALICPLGLEELRCVLRYEQMNLQFLIVAVRTNQILLDNGMRQLAEMDLLIRGYAVANPVQEFQANIHELTVKRLPEERRNINFTIQTTTGDYAFNILTRKHKSKDVVEKIFQKVRQSVVNNCNDKVEVILRQLRTCRMMLCHDFCEEMQGVLCQDSLRLELLQETSEMRRRAYLLPRESMVHKLPFPKDGEHQYAAYKEEIKDDSYQTFFFNKEADRIGSYWAVPSFAEVMAIEQQLDEFKLYNLQDLYKFDLADPSGGDINDPDRPLPEFYVNDQEGLIKKRLPKVSVLDVKQSRDNMQERLRFVQFQEGFTYKDNTALQYLYYMRQFQNLFDLEFFVHKLPSKTFSIGGLEQQVMSGLPFWDESDESFFDDSDEYL